MTPLKAIREKCLDCTNNQPVEIRLCTIKKCALWPFRMGHNPNRAGLGGNVENFRAKTARESGHTGQSGGV